MKLWFLSSILGITGCVTGGISEKGYQMHAEELLQYFEGNSVSVKFYRSKTRGIEYYNPDGRVAYKDQGRLLRGAWRINELDELCTKYFNYQNGKEHCHAWYHDQGEVVAIAKSGQKKKKISLTVIKVEVGDSAGLMN